MLTAPSSRAWIVSYFLVQNCCDVPMLNVERNAAGKRSAAHVLLFGTLPLHAAMVCFVNQKDRT
jgi:hypothetical protein